VARRESEALGQPVQGDRRVDRFAELHGSRRDPVRPCRRTCRRTRHSRRIRSRGGGLGPRGIGRGPAPRRSWPPSRRFRGSGGSPTPAPTRDRAPPPPLAAAGTSTARGRPAGRVAGTTA
jgi:hypothetical protein